MFTAYKKFWTHYADFEGKSTRSDYWWSVLCNALITLPFVIIAFGAIMTAIFSAIQQAAYYEGGSGFDPSVFIAGLGSTLFVFVLLSLFGIATLIPNLAIIVRRLRDAGYHWAFIFLYAGPILLMWVPILNILAAVAMLPCSIALIVLLCMPTKVQPMVYQGQFTAQQAQPQQQPVQAQQFTQPQEPVQEQAVEPETTPTQPQQESAITTETPEQVVQSDEKELDSSFSEDN